MCLGASGFTSKQSLSWWQCVRRLLPPLQQHISSSWMFGLVQNHSCFSHTGVGIERQICVFATRSRVVVFFAACTDTKPLRSFAALATKPPPLSPRPALAMGQVQSANDVIEAVDGVEQDLGTQVRRGSEHGAWHPLSPRLTTKMCCMAQARASHDTCCPHCAGSSVRAAMHGACRGPAGRHSMHSAYHVLPSFHAPPPQQRPAAACIGQSTARLPLPCFSAAQAFHFVCAILPLQHTGALTNRHILISQPTCIHAA